MTDRRPFAASLLVLLFAWAVSAPHAHAREPVEFIDGIPHVTNPAEPLHGTVSLTLEERWRVGGEDDDTFFGMVGQVCAGPGGEIYLLDSQLSEVQVYSTDGEHLRTIGREGDGPGEVRRPGDMYLTPSGKVALMQTFPGKMVLLETGGDPAGGFDLGGTDPNQGRFGVLVNGRAAGGQIALTGIRMSMSQPGVTDQAFFLSLFDEKGDELHPILGKGYQINYNEFILNEEGMDFVWSGRYDVGPDGRVFAVPDRNRYAIHVYGTDGQLERVIEREYRSRQRTDEEKNEARLSMEAVGRNYPVPPQRTEVMETDPDIVDLRVLPPGEIWVRTSRGDRERAEGVLVQYDVFDGEGTFQRRIDLKGPGDPLKDAVFLLGGGRAVVVTRALEAFRTMQGVASGTEETEETPMEVIYYAYAP